MQKRKGERVTKFMTTFEKVPIIWVWVIIHIVIAIVLWLYNLIKPCSDGIVIGSCAFGTNYVKLSLLESVIVYLFIANVYKFWKVRHGKTPRMREYIFIGAISSLWVIGPLISTNTIVGCIY